MTTYWLKRKIVALLYERRLIENFEKRTEDFQLMLGVEPVEAMRELCAESVFMVTRHHTEDGLVVGDCHDELGRTAINAHFEENMTRFMQRQKLPDLTIKNYTKAFASTFAHNFSEVDMTQDQADQPQLLLMAPKTV